MQSKGFPLFSSREFASGDHLMSFFTTLINLNTANMFHFLVENSFENMVQGSKIVCTSN
jgi:hypothetical protein